MSEPADALTIERDETTEPSPAETALLDEAARRGWFLHQLARGRWSAHDRDCDAGMSYTPPDGVVRGAVSAYDSDRTILHTGIDGPAEAVAHLRAFFGWPEGGNA